MSVFNRRYFRKKFYAIFIEPRQQQESLRNRELVFNVVTTGTGLFMLALFLLLLHSFFVAGHEYVTGRLVIGAVGVGFVFGLLWLSRHVQYEASAYLLVAFYTVLAGGSVAAWGFGEPFSALLLGLVIVLASTVLSSRHALYAAALSSAIVITVQLGNDGGWLVSHPAQPSAPTGLADAVAYSVVYAILATISWLFGRKMEQSLIRAEAAETALEQEKATLETRVVRRTAQLKKLQVEEMQQLYHFAEVGQLSTSLLHDLANHLTVLTFEIEGIRSKKHTAALMRSQQTITRLNTMIDEVRDRLTGVNTEYAYDPTAVIDEAVSFARDKAKNQSSEILIELKIPELEQEQGLTLYGDPLKFSQILTILIGNAVDAYANISIVEGKPLLVTVIMKVAPKKIVITVEDHGVGIAIKNRDKIFKSSYSTKRTGMGIGLYLAKQMVATEFSGSLELSPETDKTKFILTLPRKTGND